MSDIPPLQASVRRHGQIAVVDLAGELDGIHSEALRGAYSRAAAQQPARIVLNFGAVTYINSTGIAAIVAVLAQARRDQIPLGACGLSDHYQEVFRITRLADFMHVYASEEAALQGV